MCGRFAQRSPSGKLSKKFKVEEVPPLAERYNVAPTQAVLGIREYGDARAAAFFKWGLVPSWAKDPAIGNKLINARSETVTEKPSFREAFARRRCLVPVDGFYEWVRPASRVGDCLA
jgi:putative SOS response-associated peptidase YedK